MRVTTLCGKLRICIINENELELKTVVDVVRKLGCKSYMSFKNIHEAAIEYEKFYSGDNNPDLIITEWYRDYFDPTFKDHPMGKIPMIIASIWQRLPCREKVLKDYRNVKDLLCKPSYDDGNQFEEQLGKSIKATFMKRFNRKTSKRI